MKRVIVAAVVLVVYFAVNPANNARVLAGEKYDLKYLMDDKSRFTVTATTKHRNQRDIMGNVMVNNTTDLAAYDFNVRSVADDGMDLDVEYVARSHETDDEQIQAGPDFSRLIGKNVKIFLTSEGDVSDFEGFDDLPPVEIADAQTTLGKDEYMNQLKNLFLPLPYEPVGIGESWSGEKTYYERAGESSIPVRINYNYTLLENARKDGVECLKITGSYTIHLEGEFTTGGMDLVLKLVGKGTETAYFAVKKGMLLSSETSSVVEGSAGNEDLGLSIPMKHDNHHTITVSFD